MAYADIHTAATDDASPLRKQVAVAIAKAAADISNEDVGTANHDLRIHWARRVSMSNEAPMVEAGVMMWKVLENATLQADPANATDSDVQFVVNSLIDTFATR